jgi:hypothetical protein
MNEFASLMNNPGISSVPGIPGIPSSVSSNEPPPPPEISEHEKKYTVKDELRKIIDDRKEKIVKGFDDSLDTYLKIIDIPDELKKELNENLFRKVYNSIYESIKSDNFVMNSFLKSMLVPPDTTLRDFLSSAIFSLIDNDGKYTYTNKDIDQVINKIKENLEKNHKVNINIGDNVTGGNDGVSADTGSSSGDSAVTSSSVSDPVQEGEYIKYEDSMRNDNESNEKNHEYKPENEEDEKEPFVEDPQEGPVVVDLDNSGEMITKNANTTDKKKPNKEKDDRSQESEKTSKEGTHSPIQVIDENHKESRLPVNNVLGAFQPKSTKQSDPFKPSEPSESLQSLESPESAESPTTKSSEEKTIEEIMGWFPPNVDKDVVNKDIFYIIKILIFDSLNSNPEFKKDIYKKVTTKIEEIMSNVIKNISIPDDINFKASILYYFLTAPETNPIRRTYYGAIDAALQELSKKSQNNEIEKNKNEIMDNLLKNIEEHFDKYMMEEINRKEKEREEQNLLKEILDGGKRNTKKRRTKIKTLNKTKSKRTKTKISTKSKRTKTKRSQKKRKTRKM